MIHLEEKIKALHATTKTLLVRPIKSEFIKGFLKSTAVRNSSWNHSTIEKIIVGYYKQIRNREDFDTVLFELQTSITLLAKAYGARYDITDEVIEEAVELVLTEFPYLSVDEIALAYRGHASGKFKVKGAETYGGEFNAAQLGKILSAYSARRKNIVGAYLRDVQNSNNKILEAKKKVDLKEKFEKEFPLMLMKAKDDFESWRDVPEFWYDALVGEKRGWLIVDKQIALDVFERATLIAGNEKNEIGKSGHVKAVIAAREFNVEKRAKVIARKLYVFEQAIQNRNWNPPIK